MKIKNPTLKSIEGKIVSLWCDGVLNNTEIEQVLAAMLKRGIMRAKRVERLRVSLTKVNL